MARVSFSDAGGAGAVDGMSDERGLPEDPTQGAWMVSACDQAALDNQAVKASILAWRSSQLRRKVLSTLAGKTQALSAAVAE
eukprot:6109205-Pyramimonas_sp.AAC.1